MFVKEIYTEKQTQITVKRVFVENKTSLSCKVMVLYNLANYDPKKPRKISFFDLKMLTYMCRTYRNLCATKIGIPLFQVVCRFFAIPSGSLPNKITVLSMTAIRRNFL